VKFSEISDKIPGVGRSPHPIGILVGNEDRARPLSRDYGTRGFQPTDLTLNARITHKCANH